MRKQGHNEKREYLRHVCSVCVPVIERLLRYPRERYIRRVTYQALKALCEEYGVVISVFILSSKGGRRCFIYSQRYDGELACAWSQIVIPDDDMAELSSYFCRLNDRLSGLFARKLNK